MIQRHPKLKQIKIGKEIQKKLALKLCRKVNVPLGPYELREISRFQGVLGEYQITVIDFHARNAIIYEGPRRGKKIVLCKNSDHYDVINPEKMPAFSAIRFFCDKCKVYYNDFLCHPSNDPCNTCLQKSCLKVEGEGNALIVLSIVVPISVLTLIKIGEYQTGKNVLRDVNYPFSVTNASRSLNTHKTKPTSLW